MSKWNQNENKIHKADIEFSLYNDLLYYTKNNKYQLCIPSSMKKKIFQIVHNNNAHKEKSRAIEKIQKSFYIHYLNSHLNIYIQYCFNCEHNQTLQHKSYRKLNPIKASSYSFQIISMDWVLNLPITQKGYDTLLTVTCKFSQKVLLIPEIITWKVADWSWKLLHQFQKCNWGISQIIISDWNQQFINEFWTTMFHNLNCSLLFSTAYHPQTNSLLKQTNQTTEIAIQFLTTSHLNKDWDLFLPSLQTQLNSAKHAVTEAAPNELVYSANSKSALNALNKSHEETVSDLIITETQEMLQQKAAEAIFFINVKAKIHYDSNHQPIEFKENDQVFLQLHKGYNLFRKPLKKISNQWCSSFRIIKKIEKLVYKLELPLTWKIHPVISIAQIEPASSNNPYRQSKPDMSDGIEVDSKMQWIINRIINKRIKQIHSTGKQVEYLVQWEGYNSNWNT